MEGNHSVGRMNVTNKFQHLLNFDILSVKVEFVSLASTLLDIGSCCWMLTRLTMTMDTNGD